MKTRLEILESIHDSLLEEMLRLEIAIRNLEDREDDDVVIPRLTPFNLDGQKTKKEMVAESMLASVENSAKEALAEQKEMLEFLEEYR
jgi:hypothetical protein